MNINILPLQHNIVFFAHLNFPEKGETTQKIINPLNLKEHCCIYLYEKVI